MFLVIVPEMALGFEDFSKGSLQQPEKSCQSPVSSAVSGSMIKIWDR